MGNYKVESVEELATVADLILQEFGDKKVILFYGEMGVGKTTLIKAMCRKLGVREETSSPTFSIINEYETENNESIYHFDFYRIDDETEVLDLGYEDYFYSGNLCFVEWPEKIPNLLPENFVEVSIVLDDENNRLISVVP